jgi:hypothetical protein
LDFYNAEIEGFPEERDSPHWNLIMADNNETSQAQFVVAYFDKGAVTLVIGYGDRRRIREFAEGDFSIQPEETLAELTSRSRTAYSTSVLHQDVIAWLSI